MIERIFRGWSRQDKKWVYGSLIHRGGYCCILPSEDLRPWDATYLIPETGCIDGYAIPVVPESVGMWIGSVDKNGRKIFEGDIAKYHIYMTYARFIDGPGEVLWVNGHCGFGIYDYENRDITMIDDFHMCQRIEIIGTVYENANLLEG